MFLVPGAVFLLDVCILVSLAVVVLPITDSTFLFALHLERFYLTTVPFSVWLTFGTHICDDLIFSYVAHATFPFSLCCLAVHFP